LYCCDSETFHRFSHLALEQELGETLSLFKKNGKKAIVFVESFDGSVWIYYLASFFGTLTLYLSCNYSSL
jgi:hypothetical protein